MRKVLKGGIEAALADVAPATTSTSPSSSDQRGAWPSSAQILLSSMAHDTYTNIIFDLGKNNPPEDVVPTMVSAVARVLILR